MHSTKKPPVRGRGSALKASRSEHAGKIERSSLLRVDHGIKLGSKSRMKVHTDDPASVLVRHDNATHAKVTLKNNQVFLTPELVLNIDLLLDVVKSHVPLQPGLTRVLRDEIKLLLQNSAVVSGEHAARAAVPDGDRQLTTQEAADLVGVSRPFIAARIDAGDIPLFQQVGNQRRVLASAVMAWHERSRQGQRLAMAALADAIDDEYPDEG
jgi:excisionase family DNA binding protein